MPLATFFAALSVCGVAPGDGVDFATRAPVGSFDTAAVVDGALANLEATDALYSLPLLDFNTEGTQLAIDMTARLSASNAVWVSFGDGLRPDSLSIGCEEGRWHVLAGDAMLPFDDSPPPLPAGAHAFRIRLVIRLPGFGVRPNDGKATVQTFEDGIPDETPAVVLGGAWQGLEHCLPSLWTQATLSLRGESSALVSLQCGTSTPPALILVR